MLKYLLKFSAAIKYARLYSKALDFASEGKYKQAIKMANEAIEITRSKVFEPILLKAHCLCQLKQQGPSDQAFKLASEVLFDDNKLHIDEKRYLLKYVLNHDKKCLSRNTLLDIEEKGCQPYSIDKVNAALRRNFPFS